jgi:hypothetical protein
LAQIARRVVLMNNPPWSHDLNAYLRRRIMAARPRPSAVMVAGSGTASIPSRAKSPLGCAPNVNVSESAWAAIAPKLKDSVPLPDPPDRVWEI